MEWLKNLISLRSRHSSSSQVSTGNRWLPRRSTAGVHVDEDTALTYSAVWSAVRVISETIACLSWHEFVKLPGGGREVQDGSAIDFMLHDQANDEMTSNTLRETLQSHALLWGNGYAEIERDKAGVKAVALLPLRPDRTWPIRSKSGKLFYETKNDRGDESILRARDVFHLKGLGFDGLIGYSVIRMARESIGMGLAAEQFGAAFYGNDSRPGGILKHPSSMKKPQREEMREEFERSHKGASNSWNVTVLENGLDFVPISIPQNDAQYIETRKFQINEISRWFRVPPHMLADLERATFSNIEQQSIEFVTQAILPWVTRWEAEANWKLFGRNNRGQRKRFNRMKIETLLRGDIESRYRAHAVSRNWGWASANDVLRMEDMNPLPANQNGDMYLIPANMVPAEKALDEPKPAQPQIPPPTDDADKDDTDTGDQQVPRRSNCEVSQICLPVFMDVLKRSLGRERARIDAEPEKVRAFWHEHRNYLDRAILPSALAFVDVVSGGMTASKQERVEKAVSKWAGEYCLRSMIESIDARSSCSLQELIALWDVEKVEAEAVVLVNLILTEA